ncbi:septum-promoting GTP-binding protein 1 [Syzygium oleosum]|uniref:septum-promoting GTP-binding protein 1 n=1 Tax=Syzygium oleosum TaxID=219896 RepID=UPI0011D29AAC|nr:septum-promoting GTP-binding protein 1 [Syzygium oleosum]
MVRFNLGRRVHRRFSTLRRCFCRTWRKILARSSSSSLAAAAAEESGKRCRYRMLPYAKVTSRTEPVSSSGVPSAGPAACRGGDGDSDLVALKIGLLGDQQIGKTSFVVKYVGDEKEEINCSDTKGLNLMDKTLLVNGARISYSIWEVEGDGRPGDHVPIACKDCVAILFMFDLTSRCTLNSVISWYQQARRWNQTAIPIIVGTKFDDFIQLPIDLQWTIASQARAYAKALNATLFFSSATYNINVNKIFKFITAKLFDLPWTVERNLTIGEPIIDF